MRIIGGLHRSRRFSVPKNITARPTTDFARENLFNVLSNYFEEYDLVKALDLFAGTGAISFELLSRGCSDITLVEFSPIQFGFINKVIKELKAEKEITPIRGDAFKFIASSRLKFDFIFADPPYDHKQLSSIPELILKSSLLNDKALFVIEHSKSYDFSQLDGFLDKRIYGSVHFSLFEKKEVLSELE